MMGSMSDSPDSPDTTPTRPVGVTGIGSTVQFALAARTLAATARQSSLAAPSFRTPPRLVGLDRTIRRYGRRGGVVAVRLRDRPWAAVISDMIDGVIAVNSLSGAPAGRARADLWNAAIQLSTSSSAEDATGGVRRVRVA